MKRVAKKDLRYPGLMISVAEEDLKMVKELKDNYYVNVSAFVRQKIKELYLSKINDNP